MQPGASPINPYIAGRALRDGRGFFGREDILSLVTNELSYPDRNAVVLFGQRRIGKTSILLQLQRVLAEQPFQPIYFDLMDRAYQPIEKVLFELADAIASETGMDPPEEADFDSKRDFFRTAFLPRLYAKLGNTRPVLLLDEFDVLDVATERDIPQNFAARAFFRWLREIMDKEPRLAFVFVLGRKAEDLSINVKATFKAAATSCRVSVLKRADAEKLIRTADREGTLSIEREVVNGILDLTSGHPFFTQLLCQIAWDCAHADGRRGRKPLTMHDVDAAVPRLLETGENIFEWIWNGLPPAERVIMATIANAIDSRHSISKDELLEILQDHGIRILTRELDVAPDTLVEWEMLRKEGEHYSFFIEIVRQWIRARKPIAKVKEELDRINPLADDLYRTAYAFYRSADFESCTDLLRRALNVNPNHLKARLLLAQALSDLGRVGDAVSELEQAYKYDAEAVRGQLVRTLLLQAETMESVDAEQALPPLGRVLQISPGHRVAQQRVAQIWMARGDAAFAKGDLDAALEHYRTAGATDKIRQIEEERQRERLRILAARAAELERKERWADAQHTYADLARQQPEEEQWKAALGRVERGMALNNSYLMGVAARTSKDWQGGMRLLADVVYTKPDYRDAAELLAEMVRLYRKNQTQEGARPKPEVSDGEPAARKPEPEPVSPRAQRQSERPGHSKTAELASISKPILSIPGLTKVTALCFDPFGEIIATASESGKVTLTLLHGEGSPAPMDVDSFQTGSAVRSMAFSPDGHRLAVVSADGSVRVWSRLGSQVSIIETRAGQCAALSPDPGLIAVGERKSCLLLARIQEGKELLRHKTSAEITCIAFGSGVSVAAGLVDGAAVLWTVHLASGRKQTKHLEFERSLKHPGRVTSIAFHPFASLLATGCSDGVVRIWDGEVNVTNIHHKCPATILGFSETGAAATAGTNGQCHLWDAENGDELLRVYAGDQLTIADYAPKTFRMATAAGEDVHIWNVDI